MPKWNLQPVSKTSFVFIDDNGNTSKEFSVAKPFNNGFALVQFQDAQWAYFDENGNFSNKFLWAWPFDDSGFGRVQKTFDKYAYIDILWNVSKNKTRLGTLAYKYHKQLIDEYDLTDNCFMDDKFLNLIIKRVMSNAEFAVRSAQSESQQRKAKAYYADLLDYVETRALSAFDNKELKKQKRLESHTSQTGTPTIEL